MTLSEEENSLHLNFGVESIDADTNKDSNFKPTATSDSQEKLDTCDELHKNEGLGDGNGLYTAFVHDTDGGQEVDPLAEGELSDGRLSLEQRTAGEEMATSSESGNEMDDGEYINTAVTGEEEDDEVTLLEEEELARAEGNDTTREIEFLKAESELPIEELLARYKQMECSDEENADEPEDAEGTSEGRKNMSNAIPVEKLEDGAERIGTYLEYDSSVAEEKDGDAVLKVEISPPETNELQKTTEEEKNQ